MTVTPKAPAVSTRATRVSFALAARHSLRSRRSRCAPRLSRSAPSPCGAYFAVLRRDGGPFQSTQTVPQPQPRLVPPQPPPSLRSVVPRAGTPSGRAVARHRTHVRPAAEHPHLSITKSSPARPRDSWRTERARVVREARRRKHWNRTSETSEVKRAARRASVAPEGFLGQPHCGSSFIVLRSSEGFQGSHRVSTRVSKNYLPTTPLAVTSQRRHTVSKNRRTPRRLHRQAPSNSVSRPP